MTEPKNHLFNRQQRKEILPVIFNFDNVSKTLTSVFGNLQQMIQVIQCEVMIRISDKNPKLMVEPERTGQMKRDFCINSINVYHFLLGITSMEQFCLSIVFIL